MSDAQPEAPKYSAEAVAAARALGAMEEAEEVRNPDHLARHFLGTRFKIIRAIGPLRALSFRLWQRAIPGIYYYLNARTRHIDRLLLEEVQAGAGQVVVLGAGYDSRAYRFREQLARVRIFEVDEPGTGRRKREKVAELLGALPPHVTYVSIDFQRDDLRAALAQAGYSEQLKTFFIWEGVSYYLSSPAVDAVLRFVAERSGTGSSVVFDYLDASVLRGDTQYYGADGARRFLERRGEPYRFGIDEGHSREFLAERGLGLVSDLTPAQMEARYLTKRDGTALGRIFAGYGMVHARLEGREEVPR